LGRVGTDWQFVGPREFASVLGTPIAGAGFGWKARSSGALLPTSPPAASTCHLTGVVDAGGSAEGPAESAEVNGG